MALSEDPTLKAQSQTYQTYIISTPDLGDVCVVCASNPTQAAALAANALEDTDPQLAAQLIESGWPDRQHVRQVSTSTRGVTLLS